MVTVAPFFDSWCMLM